MEKYQEKRVDPRGNITYGSIENEEFITFYGGSDLPFTIEKIGITYPDKNYYIKRKRNDYIVLEFVLDGIGYVTVDGVERVVSKGDVYILLPGSPHKYRSDEEKPYKKIWINFFSDMFVDIIHGLKLNDVVYHTDENIRAHFENLIAEAQKNCMNDTAYLPISKIVYDILADLAIGRNKASVSDNSVAEGTLILLDSRVYAKPEIKEIAEELFVSVPYLIRQFRKQYGVTPYQYLIQKKINLAKNTLRYTDMRIGDIARQLAFDDEHYFSTLFKNKTGMTPSAYREAIKENSGKRGK